MGENGRRWCGWLCVVAGLIGVLQTIVILAVPAQVDSERFSYPLDSRAFAITHVTFFLRNLGLVLGLVALSAIPAARRARAARWGFRVAATGVLLLGIQELVAITAADELTTSSTAQLISTLYAVPVLLTGVGLLIGGISLAQQSRPSTPGWMRWIPAALGVWVFVPLVPALMISSMLGRLAIGGWMLLYVALGWALSRRAMTAWLALDDIDVRVGNVSVPNASAMPEQ